MSSVGFQLVNFTAAARKFQLIPSNYFSPDDSISWIWAPPLPVGTGLQLNLQGPINGVNTVFTSPAPVSNGILVFLNGLLLDPAISYTVAESTVTFTSPPQVGDDIMAIVSGNTTGISLLTVSLLGIINGTNPTFTLPQIYNTTCLVLKNGVIQTLGVMYTIAGETITFIAPYIPQSGDILQAVIS
jgi:hypothetical protein